MNVLLAEANVPYEQLKEMDEVNPSSRTTDVVLVVGANDVVNPAARTTPGTPIYGMPILDVDEAQHVVFLKRSMRPGFAGIENELLYRPQDDAAVRRREGLADQGASAPSRPLSAGVLQHRLVSRACADQDARDDATTYGRPDGHRYDAPESTRPQCKRWLPDPRDRGVRSWC